MRKLSSPNNSILMPVSEPNVDDRPGGKCPTAGFVVAWAAADHHGITRMTKIQHMVVVLSSKLGTLLKGAVNFGGDALERKARVHIGNVDSSGFASVRAVNLAQLGP
jgi:hypothetical protein